MPLPPWTPNDPLAFPASDEIMDVPLAPPSPYSPPPASLMSGSEEENVEDYDTANQHPMDDDTTTVPTITKTVQRPRRRQPLRTVSSAPPQPLQRPDQHHPDVLPAVLYMKQDLQQSHTSLRLLQQENAALTAEVDRFQHEMQRWQKALAAAQTAQRNAQDRATAAEIKIREQQREHTQAMSKTEQEWQEQIQSLRANLADATEREQKWLVEKREAVGKELAVQAEQYEKKISSLEEQLAVAVAAEQSATTALDQKNQALKDSYAKYNTIRAERDTLQKQQRRRSIHTGKEKELQEELDKTTRELAELRKENKRLVQEMATKEEGTIVSGSSKENDIPDRLARMHYATQLTVLSQQHRAELSRQKEEHEAELKRLGARHDQDLRDVFDEAKSKASAKIRESRRKLQQDFESKAATVERQHRTELSRVSEQTTVNRDLLCASAN